MAKYVCVKLVNNTCHEWQEYQTSVDMLAISQNQADAISLVLILVFVGAFKFRAIANIILRRRY
ncbi:MAG: hypothetical protein D8B60_00500 [Moraxella sp.]|nr:MAG: hypothetical protein D8B60_00500 [Moraxella sp.]